MRLNSIPTTHRFLSFFILIVLLTLVLLQGYSYWYRQPLSLGPRVILQPLLMRQGYLLYEHIADEHSPLMYYLLAALAPLVPDGLRLAKMFLIALISLLTLTTFLAGQKTAGQLAGLIAALFFVIWSPAFGFGKLWHETLLALIYVLLLVLYSPIGKKHNSKTMLVMGLLGGLGILIKQHAIVVVVGMFLWYAILEKRVRHSYPQMRTRLVQFMLGVFSPLLIYSVYHYLQSGTLNNYLYWTLGFNLVNSYIYLGAQAPNADQIRLLYPAYLLLPITILYAIGLKESDNEEWQRIGWGLLLLVTGSFTIYPRFALFHLQPSLPILAYLSATSLIYALRYKKLNGILKPKLQTMAQLTLLAIVLWIVTIRVNAFQIAFSTNQPPRIWEYSDLVPLANVIRQQIGTTDCFYIFPDDEATSNLYYLTQCSPPKPWVLTYPWFMLVPTKRQILMTLVERPPEWIIYAPGRWDIESHAPEIIAYVQTNYQFFTYLSWSQGEIHLLKRKP